MKHYKISVRGRVQGVNFRQATCEKAKEFHLQGYVMNQADGSVLIQAEGEELQLIKLLDWCRKGPALAHVESVHHEELTPAGFSGFEIRRIAL